jgi:hypothetical protein
MSALGWSEREPKYDLRDWSPDGEKMGKATVTFFIPSLQIQAFWPAFAKVFQSKKTYNELESYWGSKLYPTYFRKELT